MITVYGRKGEALYTSIQFDNMHDAMVQYQANIRAGYVGGLHVH